MQKNVAEFLNERENFLGHLQTDINNYDQSIQHLTKEKEELEKLISNLKSLKTYPEHESLIPLGKNIYMKGRLVHTGEFYVKRNAHPDPMVILQTSDQVIESLENEFKSKEEDIDKTEYAKFQIEERIKVLKGEDTLQATDNDLPKEIKSDKGVAIRMGDYYEILEYEN
ncbi:unnamed protein product [Psylliodes chrysocephalus]|uniref:Uncharacterized protein n=1 Tax=Psylliodes chrysocephalus TaxID=3402493 RepID=A0A9P0D903_9CUCU|nr:unnamed protein product [Psylliodes chrysocephala]